MRKLSGCLVLALAATSVFANDPVPNDSFDYFFENQKILRDKAKSERQQFLFPKGERFTSDKEAKDAIISLRWFAVAGDPNAQATLGDLFGKGLYEPHNIKSAVYWWNLAAENGNLYAQYMMGLNYQLGWTGSPDANRANQYFSYAHGNDDSPRARRQVAQFFGDRENAMYNADVSYRWYESAAESGDIPSQLTLGDFYTNGENHNKNTLMALKWYGRAAAQKDPYAEYSLGVLYMQGDKVIHPDYNQGIEWIEKSACQNFAAAQSLLGRFYYTGLGVPQNNALAYSWWTLANREKNPDLEQDLAQVTKKMSVEELNQAVKLADYYQTGKVPCGTAVASLKGHGKGAQYHMKGALYKDER